MKQRCGCFLFFALLLVGCGRDKDDQERKPTGERAEKAAKKEQDEPFVQLSGEVQNLAGIRTQVLQIENIGPQTVAYGKTEEDPSESFVLHASIAGNLRAAAHWPGIGDKVKAGLVIGFIEPRFTPSERVALNTQLASAQSELSASTASVEAALKAYERARVLNADDKNISDRVVQEAETRFRSEQARQKAASETLRALTGTQPANQGAGRPLIIERTGEVVEIAAQPGEAIESGVAILRVTRLDRLLARVDIPLGDRVAPNTPAAFVLPAGYEDQPPLRASRIAASAAVDPKSPGASLLFRLNGTRFGLRPGLPVTAYLNGDGAARRGIVIPLAAVIRVAGLPFVYVQAKPGRYERRAIVLDQPVLTGYVAAFGFAASDRVVTVGAQTLLSEEFKSQLKGDDEH